MYSKLGMCEKWTGVKLFTLLFIADFDCILGETIVRNNSVDQAVDYRDGMAKVC